MVMERRLDADGPRRSQPRLRPSVGPARRRQGVRLGHADGHGAPADRRRHAAVQGDAQPRSADGQARLSAAACQRRDRQRHRPADRPAASARLLHGAVGERLAEHRREEQRLPLRRPARRAGVRAAGLHASRGDHGFARSADQPPLARFDPHQLRRADRRAGARPGQGRGQPVQRPRARPASLEHRDRRRWIRPRSASRGTRRRACRCRAAGAISKIPSSWSRASTRSAGRQARCMPARVAPGWKLAGTLAWGRKTCRADTSDDALSPKPRSSMALDHLRPRRNDRKPRAGRRSTSMARPITVGKDLAGRGA